MNSDNTDSLKMYLCDSACVEVRQQLVRMWVPGGGTQVPGLDDKPLV